ncbi:MAG: hypothetical protein ACRDQ5_13680 [Sciscionella sp.]
MAIELSRSQYGKQKIRYSTIWLKVALLRLCPLKVAFVRRSPVKATFSNNSPLSLTCQLPR